MARIRSIHPTACGSEKLGLVSSDAERLYWRLQTHLDDEGRCEDNPRLIRGVCAAMIDDWTTTLVDGLLDELANVRSADGSDEGLIVRYQVGRQRVIQAVKFDQYQKPRHPRPSDFPAHYGTSPTACADPPYTDGDISHARRQEWSGEGVEKEQEQEHPPSEPVDKLEAALDLVLDRRGTHDSSRRKHNPAGWLAAARTKIRQELTEAYPDGNLDPGAWADLIEPDPSAASATRARQAEQATRDMLERDREARTTRTPPPPDMRAALTKTTTNDPCPTCDDDGWIHPDTSDQPMRCPDRRHQ